MGTGGGILGGASSSRGGRGGRGSSKPWDNPRRNYPQYFYRVAQEDEDREKMMERISKDK